MNKVPFVAIRSDELGIEIGEQVDCPHCGWQHPVQQGQAKQPDGTYKESRLLSFYNCGEKSYLCAVRGHSVMHKFKQEKNNVN